MAAVSTTFVTLEEIKFFYKMDRNLYALLTITLWRDPIESLRVMALWLWLERGGFNNIVRTISSLSHFMINKIADEAISCFNSLTCSNPFTLSSQQIELPLTQRLLGADLSAKFSLENRDAAILGIERALNEVCLKALSDIMQHALERNAARTFAETQIAMSSFVESGFSRLNIGSSNPRVNNPPEDVHPDERTMFVTFSRGYPVPEMDIREFFNFNYGDCIESVRMQEVPLGEQSLYACIVFHTPDVIERVLNGAEKAKFTIRGRHMWARKFVPKRRRHVIPPRSLLSRPGASGSGSLHSL